MLELRDAIYDSNGKLLPWGDFLKKALSINSQYNINYLKTERDMVIRSGIMGSKWLDIEADADLYPFLQYETMEDANVRPEHAALNKIILPVADTFWHTYYPPNGWNCRCSVKQLARIPNGMQMADSDHAQILGGKAVPDKIFRGNSGISGAVFSDQHAYYKGLPNKQLNPTSYGMLTPQQIFGRPGLPPMTNNLTDIAAYDNWWQQQVVKHASSTVNAFELESTITGTSVLFDSELMAKLVEKERFMYADLIPAVLNNADEVWSGYLVGKKFKGEFLTTYIKYYSDGPVVMLVDNTGRVRSFYKLESVNDVNRFRAGLLLYKK